MEWNLHNILGAFKGRESFLAHALHGLEKESLRIDRKGRLAMTPHPKGLGSALTDPYITTDFSESQPELITPPLPSIEEAVAFLDKLHVRVHENIGDELLWPMSMPPQLPDEKDIPIADYGDSEEGRKREIYRRGLALRYGKYMQTICGVHYNMSFTTDFWEVLHKQFGGKSKLKDFINESYLHLVRNFIRHRWLLVLFFGASPFKHESYKCKLMVKEKTEAVSLRSSRCGYSNPAKVPVSYNSYKQHLADLQHAVEMVYPPYTALGLEQDGVKIQLNDHLLQVGNEYYFSIRLKPRKPYEDMVHSLVSGGVTYLEVRIFDVNPFVFGGVTVDQLYFAHMFLLYCLVMPSPPLNDADLDEATMNQQTVALHGRNTDVPLQRSGQPMVMKQWTQELLDGMRPLAVFLDKALGLKVYEKVLADMDLTLRHPHHLLAYKLIDDMEKLNLDFLGYGLKLAKNYAAPYHKRV